MRFVDIPTKIDTPFGKNAATGYIRSVPDTSSDPTVATYSLGFPPATATPVDAGGTPPNIADFNGLFNQITAWTRWQGAGNPAPKFDGTFASEIGGYPAGAIVQANSGPGNYFLCQADNNSNDPNVTPTGWYAFTLIGLAPLASPTFTGNPRAPTQAPLDDSTKLATTAYVDAAVSAEATILNAAIAAARVPTGSVFWFAATAAPTNYLECNGAAVSRTTYAALFGVIGTTFGVGNGTTTFNLPDLRGEFVRGYDDGRGVDPGRAFGSTQADDFKSHTHTFNWNGDNSGGVSPGHGGGGANFTGPTSATGGTETRPKNVALLPCIKT